MNSVNDGLSKEDRQSIIIEFIRSKPYCNIQDVVQGVENRISRVTVFKLLRELIENGAVKRYLENNQKRNAREHKLFVDESNPLVSVRSELDKFESAYFDLFKKVFVEFDPKDVSTPTKHKHYVGLVVHTIDIFFSMVDAMSFRCLLVWSQEISDQRMLQRLYSIVFSKIADMQARLSESLKSTIVEDSHRILTPFITFRLRGSQREGALVQYLDSFRKSGMEKEIESVTDSLWKIFGDLQPIVYPEPRIHGWPFKYGEDDWRKLIKLLRQHPNETVTVRNWAKNFQKLTGPQV